MDDVSDIGLPAAARGLQGGAECSGSQITFYVVWAMQIARYRQFSDRGMLDIGVHLRSGVLTPDSISSRGFVFPSDSKR